MQIGKRDNFLNLTHAKQLKLENKGLLREAKPTEEGNESVSEGI